MLSIRKVTQEDSELILTWRNDPRVYRFALNSNPVQEKDHETWFKAKLESKKSFWYMGLYDGTPCGTVRYDATESEEEVEISISVAPEFWGKGLATQMMALGEKELVKSTKVLKITATVLTENKKSMDLFERSGYETKLVRFKKIIREQE